MGRALDFETTGHRAVWDDTYEALAYTAFALMTQADDPRIGPLLGRVRGVLADWERMDAERRQVRGAAIAARAHVRMADAALDVALRRFATDVLKAADGDRGSDLYRRFFPEPHEEVIELGLDAELPAASVVMAQLDEGGEVPEPLKAHVAPLRAALTVGNGALTERAEAYARLGRLQARVEAWLESADATAGAARAALGRLGEERGMTHRWTAAFFVARP